MADKCGNWTVQNEKISTKHKYEMQKIVQTQPLNPKLSLKKKMELTIVYIKSFKK